MSIPRSVHGAFGVKGLSTEGPAALPGGSHDRSGVYMVRSEGDCVVFMDCWAEYERITARPVEQVSGIFKTVAVKGMQVEVVVERHGQYNKAFDMQP